MSINDLLNKTISISRVDRNYAGDPETVDIGDFDGHLEFTRSQTFTEDEEQISTTSIVYVEKDAPLKPQTEYELEVDGYDITSKEVAFMEDPRIGRDEHNHWQIKGR